jgi:hypothetical protein
VSFALHDHAEHLLEALLRTLIPDLDV